MKNNFRILIAEKKLSIADVHNGTGISKTTLYGIYRETTTNPDSKTIIKLCDYLNVTPNEFFGVS